MKNAFITGVSGGLGQAFVFNLLEAGYHVTALSRHFPKDMAEPSSNLDFHTCDISDFEALGKTLGSLNNKTSWDLVLLNAGAAKDLKDLKETDFDEIDELMTINVWANKVILDHLLKTAEVSQVIAISSGASVNGNRGWAGYSLSKATLNMLIQLYAAEDESAHFLALAPGLVQTDMLSGLLENSDKNRFPSLQRLHEAEKLSPSEVSHQILQRLERLKELPSGSFQDLRDLRGESGF